MTMPEPFRLRWSWSVAVALAAAAFIEAAPARAQLELGSALRSLGRSGQKTLPRAVLRSASGRVAVLAEYAPDSGVSELLVAGRYRPLWLAPGEVTPFLEEHPGVKLHWAPPRHTLLDEADKALGDSGQLGEVVLGQAKDCAAGAHFSRQHRCKALGHGTP